MELSAESLDHAFVVHKENRSPVVTKLPKKYGAVAIAVVCLVLTLALPIYIDLAKLMELLLSQVSWWDKYLLHKRIIE